MEWGEGDCGAALHVASMLWFDCGPTAPREAECESSSPARMALSGAQLHQPSSPMATRFAVSFVTKVKADTVAPQGIEPVVGSLDDAALLQAEARAADAVVNAASSDHRGAVEVLIAGRPVPENRSSIPAAAASWLISPWVNLRIEFFMRGRQLSRKPKRPPAWR
jgi:hypothetical protein